MVKYDDMPLFPLHVVLFPEMPLPLHIFEPRYREMILRCREENSVFGVTLIGSGMETQTSAVPSIIGTTARIAQYEEMPDGRMNILVFGETRFRIERLFHNKPFLSGQVQPFWEEAATPEELQTPVETVGTLFRKYLRSLFAMTGRSLSALQLPQEPEHLSFAVASVLQVSLTEKQNLLEITDTARRLEREAEVLQAELEAHETLQDAGSDDMSGLILPVDTRELGKMASRN